ncbi:MAG: DUF4965 domain-containing protein [Armatimonadetes bacterium]|nr:DUF4965 domain-containing protein [Armatimonadota bacterium]
MTRARRRLPALALAAALLAAGPVLAEVFRPPAVPLVTHDPYLSIWSRADRLADQDTTHWSRRPHTLCSLIRIDGRAYRLMGRQPADLPAMPQVGLQVTPTRTLCTFDDGRVRVELSFLAPALPHDLDALSLPLTYLTWQVRSVDRARHRVALFDSTSVQLAVNTPEQEVAWGRESAGPLTLLRAGTVEQAILGSSGDSHNLDWGYVYAATTTAGCRAAIGEGARLRDAFAAGGSLPGEDDTRLPRAANDAEPALAFEFDLGQVTALAQTRQVIIALDEIYAIRYTGRKLRPYWRRQGASPQAMLTRAAAAYRQLAARCAAFDRELTADLTTLGGDRYAQLCALAYRQALGACGLAADARGQPLLFPKENTSNGDIATVDVIYPLEPMLLLLSPRLAKAAVAPVLNYASSPRWRWASAPHDLGTYPNARGTDEAGEGMPVEETANLLLLCDAIAHADGNADFVTPWWPTLGKWAVYLEQYGLDPADQLCTDDFMGHLAHNANLSLKAILALAAYGDLCRLRRDTAGADRYARLARSDADHWQQVAADGDHSRLAFDQPGTWSQKYNLVWDRILGLDVFPVPVSEREVSWYRRQLGPYGVPLDSRTKSSKTDWAVWSASLAWRDTEFRALVSPIWDYMNQTTARDPLPDLYPTDGLGRGGGMFARPVVGGLFVRMLTDPALWRKWAGRGKGKPGPWAPLPPPPQVTEVVASSQHEPQVWRYTTDPPRDGWALPDFDDSGWKEAPAGFGTAAPNAVVRTPWNTSDVWIRRKVLMPPGKHANLALWVYHDEDVEIYVNAVLAARAGGFVTTYTPLDIRRDARDLLQPGAEVTLAAHCHQTAGGQNLDIGLADVVDH